MENKPEQYAFLGFGIDGYRSFASGQPAMVGPFGKVHLITGQNNSGKSALASVAFRILPSLGRGGTLSSNPYPLCTEDLPQRDGQQSDAQMTLSLCFSKDSLLERVEGKSYGGCNALDIMANVLSSETVSHGDQGACWLDFAIPATSQSSTTKDLVFAKTVADALAEEFGTDFNEASLAISSRAEVSSQGNLSAIFSSIVPWNAIPSVVKVEAIRHITDNDAPRRQVISNGEGLVKELRRLKLPTVKDQFVSGRKWDRFERFVRDILNDPAAEIATDDEARAVLVKSGTPGFLELSDLGTGIEEIVMMAAVVACNDDKLIFIEEPEIHLHPTLQSKLIEYFLDDANGNRFLITTHSPSIINVSGVTVTQVSKTNGVSDAVQVRGVVDARDVLGDIGARPSDLLQSNYVIWVEGPSDRIYVNYWLSVVDPQLSEGMHYSIMVYGGKLLNACGADATYENDELIALFKINTHFCVLMDSDRRQKGARLNATKRRIRSECESSGNMSWVTDGRTIENYIPAAVLRDAISALYPGKKYDWEMGDRYICPLSGVFAKTKSKPDKIKVARWVANIGYSLPPELLKHVEKLAERIREANGMRSFGKGE